jgi:hypothetical protein
VQTPSPMSRRRGGCRGARLQIASCKRAGRTGDSRPLALRKGVGRTGGVISRHSPMPVSRGTHRCVQGDPFVKRTRSTSALRLFIPVLRKVVEWIHLRSGAGGGKTRSVVTRLPVGAPRAPPKSMCREPPRGGGRSCARALCIAISVMMTHCTMKLRRSLM